MKQKDTFAVWTVTSAILLLFLTVCLSTKEVFAAAPPDSGVAMDSVKQSEPPPTEEPATALVVPEPETVPPSGSRRTVRVEGFRLEGESPVPTMELLKLIAARADHDLTLDDLNRLADKITTYLRSRGYPVAFAYIPAQQIRYGIVAITVVPGKFGAVEISNRAHIATPQFQKFLAVFRPGAIIIQKDLERAMLLINDLPGITARARLKPGQQAGTSDLVLEVEDTQGATGNASTDTWGGRYTGSERGGVRLTLNNLDHIGDELSLGGLISGKGWLNNASLAYNAPLSGDGLRLSLSCNAVSYTLGEDFAALDATGQVQVYGLELSYPFIRSRHFNFYGQAGFEDKELRDVIGSTAAVTPRTSHLWHLGLTGNSVDAWRGGGVNQYSLTLYSGYLKITGSAAYDTDASSAGSAGGFAKALLSYSRSQYLAPDLNLNLRCNGQLATKNLDSSEKFYLGGAEGIRAYPQGEGAGDEGLRLTAEIQWRMPGMRGDGKEKLYLIGFCDYGYITVNKNPWDAAAINRRGLSGVGFGFLYTWSADFSVRCDYAWKLGNAAATSDTDQAGRLWVRVVKSF